MAAYERDFVAFGTNLKIISMWGNYISNKQNSRWYGDIYYLVNDPLDPERIYECVTLLHTYGMSTTVR